MANAIHILSPTHSTICPLGIGSFRVLLALEASSSWFMLATWPGVTSAPIRPSRCLAKRWMDYLYSSPTIRASMMFHASCKRWRCLAIASRSKLAGGICHTFYSSSWPFCGSLSCALPIPIPNIAYATHRGPLHRLPPQCSCTIVCAPPYTWIMCRCTIQIPALSAVPNGTQNGGMPKSWPISPKSQVEPRARAVFFIYTK